MAWINTLLLIAILVLVIHAKITAITAEQVLLYLGLTADEIREVMKKDKTEFLRKLKGLKIDISDQLIKDLKKEKERHERTNQTR